MPPEMRSRAASVAREEVFPIVEPLRGLTVQDTLYGQIEFPPIIRILTDSPIVQRLRDLKQLGNSYYVYPSATHSRFEHSLGVCYLGMEFYRSIIEGHQQDSRDFGVPGIAKMTRSEMEKTKHCIGIAGLCHDLGHGPLSHVFEQFVRSSGAQGDASLRKWSHEAASIMLLDKLWLEKNKELTDLGFDDSDLAYVKLLINGLPPGQPWVEDVRRPSWVRFTTEIIANKRNGIDVDKIDYIQRDSVACLGSCTFVSMRRLFQGARVLVDYDGETTIGYPDKMDGIIEEIFFARSNLHRIVYQHRVAKIIDLMTLDALRAAGDVMGVKNGEGHVTPLRSCMCSPDFYVNASDWIISAILHGSCVLITPSQQNGQLEVNRSAKVAEAQHILQRIQNRQLYTTIGSFRHSEVPSARKYSPSEMPSFSQEVKPDAVIAKLLTFMKERHRELNEKMDAWSKEHDNLEVIKILQAEITQTAGDMDKNQHPLNATNFFNPRQSVNSRIEAHPYRNVTTTMAVIVQPVSSLTVVSRMPLTPTEAEALRQCFDLAIEEVGSYDAKAFSCTPVRKPNGDDSSSRRPSQRPYGEVTLSQQMRQGSEAAEDCDIYEPPAKRPNLLGVEARPKSGENRVSLGAYGATMHDVPPQSKRSAAHRLIQQHGSTKLEEGSGEDDDLIKEF